MRGLLLLAAILGCAGCVRPEAAHARPAALVAVFADGFHSGVMIDRAEIPVRLLPSGPDADGGWAVAHFGERRWILGVADGCSDGLRLGLTSGDGGVQIDLVPGWRHGRGGTDREGMRLWLFPVSRAEADALVAQLEEWAPAGAPGGQIGPSTCWWPSPRRWRLGCNCHDFTAELLRSAGIPVADGLILTAAGLRAALDAAWEAREGASSGLPVAEPLPDR